MWTIRIFPPEFRNIHTTPLKLVQATRDGTSFLVLVEIQYEQGADRTLATVKSRYDLAKRRFLDYGNDADIERHMVRAELTVGDRLDVLFPVG